MAKYNIDDILNDLGVDKRGGKALPGAEDAPRRVDVESLVDRPAAVRAASPDSQEQALSPIPAAPANQRSYNELVRMREAGE